ncbi:hypothetical protein [Haloimpatiens massiliensis]|uniref:hypothetical protein n=1 Tax=Haloimpatiens massiliensis TaxID=1658110 RepID=UPI000C83C109|nr:hypothetical protein [Haloimpatiens massiliensis]
MFNNNQVESIPEKLGLSYRWLNPESGANVIIVENVIEFKPFSNWITDLRNNKKYHSDTIRKFQELCRELANK